MSSWESNIQLRAGTRKIAPLLVVTQHGGKKVQRDPSTPNARENTGKKSQIDAALRLGRTWLPSTKMFPFYINRNPIEISRKE